MTAVAVGWKREAGKGGGWGTGVEQVTRRSNGSAVLGVMRAVAAGMCRISTAASPVDGCLYADILSMPANPPAQGGPVSRTGTNGAAASAEGGVTEEGHPQQSVQPIKSAAGVRLYMCAHRA